MIFSGPAASRRTVRSICIHRSYGIKYTWHVHESDNCHSCSTDVSINRVRSFVLPFVRVGSLARSFVFTPSHFFPFLFLCISLSFSALRALFIAIIPRYALASHPRSFGTTRFAIPVSRFASRGGRRKEDMMPAKEKQRENEFAHGYVAPGNSSMSRVLFSSVPFLTSLHTLFRRINRASLDRRSLTNDRFLCRTYLSRSRDPLPRLCVNNRGGIRSGENRHLSFRESPGATFLRNSETLS